jgi:osmoprotectant transport system substrate-binding protein
MRTRPGSAMSLRSPLALAAIAVAGALTLAACGSSSTPSSGASGTTSAGGNNKPIVVASFNFGESQLLAAMYVDVLKKAGFDASTKSLGAREIVEPALEKGSASGGVDVVPEYLSTFTEFLNVKANGKNAPAMASPDVNATLANAKTLAANVNIDVLTPSAATDQNAFAVTKDFATKNNLTKLSDLASYSGPLVLGGPPECPTRPFCKPGLEKTYGIHFTGFKSLDAGGPLTKKALQQGKIQIGLVFSSDAGIEVYGLQVLDDDKHLQNVDAVVATVNKSVDSAALDTALNGVAQALTTDELVQLNKKVDVDGQDPADVAQQWLSSKGLA